MFFQAGETVEPTEKLIYYKTAFASPPCLTYDLKVPFAPQWGTGYQVTNEKADSFTPKRTTPARFQVKVEANGEILAQSAPAHEPVEALKFHGKAEGRLAKWIGFRDSGSRTLPESRNPVWRPRKGPDPDLRAVTSRTRIMTRRLLPGFVLAMVITAHGWAEESSYFRMPWHLVDLWWSLGEDWPFESYSLDVTISDDVPASSNLYIAPIGLGHLSGSAFYGGIQTQADGHTKGDPRVRKIGPGFLMSMWGERKLDAIRPSLGGFCQSSDHEGDFVSVRRPYAWSRGTYTYRIVRMDRELVDGRPTTWVGAFVHNHQLDEHVFVGALRFKGENLVLGKGIASFVEVYGRPIPVAEIPKVVVTFSNLRVNGQPLSAPPVEANYPRGVPDYAEARASGGSVVIQVGAPVEGRSERRVRLVGD